MSNPQIVVRRADRLHRLLHWRREVLECVFGQPPDDALMLANERYYAQALPSGQHYAVEALCNGLEAGCGSICLSMELPSPDNNSGRCAYLMNIYTRPQFRGKGVATAIVRHLIDKARQDGCDKIFLETTAMGQSLYTEIGFEPLPGIMKFAYDKFAK